MARSYFSRILPGGVGKTLVPPRPVSNLWKAALIDSMEAEAPQEASGQAAIHGEGRIEAAPEPGGGTGIATRPRAAIAGRQEMAVQSVRPSPGARQGQAPNRGGAMPPYSADHFESNPARSNTPPAALDANHTHPLDPVTPPQAESTRRQSQNPSMTPDWHKARSRPHLEPARSTGEQARAMVPGMRGAELGTPLKDTAGPGSGAPAISPEWSDSKWAPRQARARNQGQEAADRTPDLYRADLAPGRESAQVGVAGPEAMPPSLKPVPREMPVFEPVRPIEAASARAGMLQDEPRPAEKNSVQIGKIEVQVVSPPDPVRYAAAPAQAKGRLARGYALWPTWQ